MFLLVLFEKLTSFSRYRRLQLTPETRPGNKVPNSLTYSEKSNDMDRNQVIDFLSDFRGRASFAKEMSERNRSSCVLARERDVRSEHILGVPMKPIFKAFTLKL